MMNKKLQAWLPLLLSIALAAGMILGYQLQGRMNPKGGVTGNYGSSSIQQILDLVNLKYVDSVNLDSIETKGIDAVVNELDPHSVYIPPSELGDVNADLQGNFTGIGVEYQLLNDTVNVVYVVPNGPSERAGIQSGDQLLLADTVNIAGKKFKPAELRTLLRGKAGSTLKLTVLQNGQKKTLEVTRGNIPIPSLDAAYMAAPGVGYIRLNKFAETTYREFMDAATGLQAKGMKKMILDLRDNGGGLLEQATNIADELLPDGKLIVSTRGNHVKTKQIESTKPGLFEDGPLVLLINEFSASASEVVAGALQDNDRGTIVGRRSFGKGLVQEQYDLANGGALRLTVARYYTPTGRSIQKPYTNGNKEKYKEELLDRFHNGDNYITDTAHAKTYTTRGGKKLYDAGGITPDVYVPFDSTILPAEVTELYSDNLLSGYVLTVFKQQRNELKKFTSASELEKNYKLPETAWTNLVAAAKKDSIQLEKVTGKAKERVEQRIKALLARYVFRGEGYYQVLNSQDSSYLKALILLKDK